MLIKIEAPTVHASEVKIGPQFIYLTTPLRNIPRTSLQHVYLDSSISYISQEEEKFAKSAFPVDLRQNLTKLFPLFNRTS